MKHGTESLPLVLAITGASGAPYAVRLLEVLASTSVPVWLMISDHGRRLLLEECGIESVDALRSATGRWDNVTLFSDGDRGAKPASGSQPTRGMIICPCSMATASAVAQGNSRSLVERAADVTLKERRKLVMVVRETPLSLIHLRNLTAVTEAGATVLPAAPGFYHRPTEVRQLIDFVVQRVLDQFAIDLPGAPRWGNETN